MMIQENNVLESMTYNDVKVVAPAVFAQQRDMKRTSDRFSFFPTIDVIEALGDRGWAIVDAQQPQARLRDPMTVTHSLLLAPEEYLNTEDRPASIPTIYLRNSHNGRTKLMLKAGLFRFACANGILAGTKIGETFVRHIGTTKEELEQLVISAENATRAAIEIMEDWQNIFLDRDAQEALALHALTLRSPLPSLYNTANVNTLLEARRKEDEGDDVWRVFNRVQEGALQLPLKAGNEKRAAVSKPPKAIELRERINTGLWDAAERLAA